MYRPGIVKAVKRFDPEYCHAKPLCGRAILLEPRRYAFDLFRSPAGRFDDEYGIDCTVQLLADGVGTL
jgi:hypothetical protein